MARIRSVHPDVFLDEAFVQLSMGARLFMFGIWTEADDHGAFEWQPTRLRFKILPGDNLSGDDLLGELSKLNIVKKVEIEGRSYGLVRNFCRFQRPKKPKFKVEIPAEHYGFVALKADGSLPSHHHITGLTQEVGNDGNNNTVSVTHRSPTDGEKPAHMKEEGGRRKGEPAKTKTESLERVPPAVSEAPPAAATLSPKAASQSRKGLAALGTPLPKDWIPDDPTCARVKTDFGMTDEDLYTELPAFHALNVQGGVLSGDWTATFYLFCKRWKEHRDKHTAPRLELNRKAAEPSKQPEQFTEAEWDSVVGMYARTGRWSRHAGSDPMSPACLAPRAILEKHGINLETGERTIPPRKVAAS